MSQTEDQLAIRALVARYADAVTRRAEADWSATWADDATWDLLGNHLEGREAILGMWRGAMASLSFVVQLVYSGVVDLDGDRARGRWTVSEMARDRREVPTLLLALYDDEYTRLPEGWRFARRSLQVLYHGPPDLSGRVSPPPG